MLGEDIVREDARAFSRALERSFFSLHPSFEYCEFIEERRGAELGINALSRLPVIDIPPALGTIPFDALNSNAKSLLASHVARQSLPDVAPLESSWSNHLSKATTSNR